ncbi:MAG: helix-turn-helix domain-containing protein [Okeania sp. SIO3H1]|nr:helix-turn-helix domain-containing protein [Okeania sp. SIO3H1]
MSYSLECKKVREQLGLSQAAFSKLMGLHSMTVSRWERGIIEIPRSSLVLIRLLRAEIITPFDIRLMESKYGLLND